MTHTHACAVSRAKKTKCKCSCGGQHHGEAVWRSLKIETIIPFPKMSDRKRKKIFGDRL